MPVKMIATRRHYDREKRLEYEKNENFEVADDREAEKLIKRRRARRAPPPPSPIPPKRGPGRPPKVQTEEVQESPTYQRRDMRADD